MFDGVQGLSHPRSQISQLPQPKRQRTDASAAGPSSAPCWDDEAPPAFQPSDDSDEGAGGGSSADDFMLGSPPLQQSGDLFMLMDMGYASHKAHRVCVSPASSALLASAS